MKTILLAGILLLTTSTGAFAQDENKKVKSFEVERVINAPAEKVWQVVGEEFTDIAKSHPLLSGSHYVEGSAKTGEGCERVCSIDEAGQKYTKEKIVNYNPSEQSFKAQISEVGGLPLIASSSYMLYNVDPIDDNSCTIKFKMVYLTDPAFMGSLAKGKFKKNIENYAIAIQHHVLTGEDVDPENFKSIKKRYE